MSGIESSVPGTTPVRPEHSTGSSGLGEPEFLAVGKLRRPHGVRGEMQMDVLTDFPERLKPGVTVYLGEHHEPHRIHNIRGHDQALLVTFDGYQNPEGVGVFRNTMVYVRVNELPPLPDGEYYHHQLLDLQVFREDGEYLGILAEILVTGANDVYVIETDDGTEILLPAINDVIREIDLERGQIRVHLLPGLLPD